MSLSKKGANNPLYGKQHKEETKTLMSKLKIGSTHSNETKNLISKALGDETYLYKIIKSNTNTEDNTNNMILSFQNDNQFENINISQDNNKFSLIGKFNSLRKVGKYFGISHSTVARYLKSGTLYQEIYKISRSLLN